MSDPDAQRRESLERWDQAAAGWAKHADWVRDSSVELSRWLIDALQLTAGQTVLELAAGPGDTGLLAAPRVAPGGQVICSDNSEAMLELARARAEQLAVANVEFRLINAESIDLPVASVDGVVCRWGLMLFVDPAAALAEMRRVLRPGARASLAVWGPPHRNLWLSVPGDVLARRGLVPPSKDGEPGPFALANEARLERLLMEAGFVEVELAEVAVERGADSFEEWWDRLLDMSQMGVALRAAPPQVQRAVTAEVRERMIDFGGLSLVAVAS